MPNILASATHKVPRAAAFGGGGPPTIAIVNTAKTDLRYDLHKMIAAMQKALDEQFSPVWGTPAKLISCASIASIPAGAWQFLLQDVPPPDVKGAEGYHDLMVKLGVPITFVFVKTTLDDGGDVAVTASHELWEMLVDPGVQLWADGNDGELWAWETADAVEETDFTVDNVRISNFVYPSFFESFRKPKSTQFDHLGLVARPFSLLKGGYTLIRKGRSVTQKFGSLAKKQRFLKEDRRLHRSQVRLELLKRTDQRSKQGRPDNLGFRTLVPRVLPLRDPGTFMVSVSTARRNRRHAARPASSRLRSCRSHALYRQGIIKIPT
jgi:hypothetical protein